MDTLQNLYYKRVLKKQNNNKIIQLIINHNKIYNLNKINLIIIQQKK